MANIGIKTNATDTGALNYHVQQVALAEGLGQLTKDLVLAKLITNYSMEAKNQGSLFAQAVRVPKTGTLSAVDKVAGTAFTAQDATSTKADITVNHHKVVPFIVEDNGSLFAQSGVLVKYITDASHRLAEAIETDIAALYASGAGYVGSAGGNASATLIRTVRSTARGASYLFDMSQPSYLVWGVNAEADLLADTVFTQFSASAGDMSAIENAFLGKKFGFENYTSNMIADISGTPANEHNMAFQRDAIGIAFVDMSLQSLVGEQFTAGSRQSVMSLNDDMGNPLYSMRLITSYDHANLGTKVSVDTIYGVDVVRAEHLIDVRS